MGLSTDLQSQDNRVLESLKWWFVRIAPKYEASQGRSNSFREKTEYFECKTWPENQTI